MIEMGSLVRACNNNLGIGKVIAIDNLNATVEYFCSIGQRILEKVSLTSLEPAKLQQQTRCYIRQENQDTWVIGRIFSWDDLANKYQIDLPNKKTILATEQEIYVRCDRPIEDPIEILAMKGQETPYFHDRRLALVQGLIEQRAVSRGMTGLISANIELYPHQVEVVRRVLEDPIQRYLLADEVGLGKTIEAGAIIRQYLLDEPQGLVAVVVPQYLVEQWRKELEEKFYIPQSLKRVQVIAVEDLNRLNPKVKVGCLILDEAHHIAAMAASSDAMQQKQFETCKYLAHQSDRLLLLSATPVLNHEQDFLAMLHLLDPITYKLNDLDGFRARVQNRQQIGRILLSFKEKANPFVIKTNLAQLRNLFPEDKYLSHLADELQSLLQNEEIPPANKDQIVRAIRTHISDTYRLHRRMLRNRRDAVEDVIFDRNVTPKLEYDLDERSPRIHELIDEWRTVAPDLPEYRRIFLLLFRAAGTWLGVLKALITTRLSGIADLGISREFGAENIRLLMETPKFSGEAEILQSLGQIIQEPSEDGDRIELLKILLLYHLAERFQLQSFRSKPQQLLERVQHRLKRPISGDSLLKIAIFTSFTQSSTEIIDCLSSAFGQDSIASHQSGESRSQVEKNLERFKNNPNCFILVCDSSGEEGRNFQFVDWVIHFDLPWSPNRLEQRIGRIDRIGRPLNVEFTVLAGVDLEDSPHDAWYQLLKDGFGIFRQSIASFQFYVDDKLPEIEATLFRFSASGLIEMIAPIQQEISDEQVKISEQNALDEIDAQDESATQYFQPLDNYDAAHQQIKRSTEAWICQALNLKCIDDVNIKDVRRYQPTTRTLIPVDELKTHFAAYIQQSGTYNRRVANQHSGIKLYRIGEEFVEALASYILWDDRGQAFAMWRHNQEWDASEGMEWLGFRFNYAITTDLEPAKQVLIAHKTKNYNFKALERGADALFPPLMETIFLDTQMKVVEDATLLNILQRSYNGKGGYARDYNLAKDRLPILDNFVDAHQWLDLCRNARTASESLLRDRSSFIELCQRNAKIAEQKLSKRVEQLRLRLNRISEEQLKDSTLNQELKIESALEAALLQGISRPRIRLDSVGFIIVSGRSPLQSVGDGAE